MSVDNLVRCARIDPIDYGPDERDGIYKWFVSADGVVVENNGEFRLEPGVSMSFTDWDEAKGAHETLRETTKLC